MQPLRTLTAALLAALAALTHAGEGPVKIKLATVAPKGSSSYKLLQALNDEWKQAPGGGAQLVIYGDGTQGSEVDVVKKMRTGVLSAGLLTAPGLDNIEPDVSGLQTIPMMFRDFDDIDFIGERLHPRLEKMMLEKGFVVLFWTDAGFVRFFTTSPLAQPDDLRKRKVFVYATDAQGLDVWRKQGYQPVSLEVNDILPGLQTGLFDTITVPPFYALAIQMDKQAPHMIDLNWAPLVGACVITRKSWEQIPEASRETLLASARRTGVEITKKLRAESQEAIESMKKRGLSVHVPTPEQQRQWIALGERSYPFVRGTLVPADVFDEVAHALAERRAQAAGTAK